MTDLEAGGYDNAFISDVPDRLVCKLCHLPSRDPHLSVCCGHIFCMSCAEWRRNSQHSECPMCGNESFSSVLNKQIDREVKALVIQCKNQSDGCTWRGQLKRLPAHRKSCEYEWAQCDYQSMGCHENRLWRQYLQTRLSRDYTLFTKARNNLRSLTRKLRRNFEKSSD